ncbi:hypothetical protein U1Q18_009899 [Sarracenia purpurea var. burkii]
MESSAGDYWGSPSTDELKKELRFATPDKENPKSIWVEKKTTGLGKQKAESGGKREVSDTEGCASEVPEPLRPNEGLVSEDTKPEDKSGKGVEAVIPEKLKGGFDEVALKVVPESEYDEDAGLKEEATGGIGSAERVLAQNGDKVGGCKKESEGKRVEVDPFGEQGEWTVVGKRKALGQDKKFLGPYRVKRHEGGEFQGVK